MIEDNDYRRASPQRVIGPVSVANDPSGGQLASLKSGPDGELVVVSWDLRRAAGATAIASTLQAALDDWAETAPRLSELALRLEAGAIVSFPFDARACASPLPRAYQWADGSAYLNHVELVRKARGAEMPPSFWTDPLMYQGGSDSFLGPLPVQADDESFGIDMEREVAAIVGDVSMGASAEAARASIFLVMLVNDVSLRNLIPPELAKGFGFFQSKPSSALSPVAVTPDELDSAWDGGRRRLPSEVDPNGKPFGRADAGRTAEMRTVERIRTGFPKMSFLKFGDRVRIEMKDGDGRSIFGAIEQEVCKHG